MGNDARGTVLTGATGFLGGEILKRMLERDERPVYALVRAASDQEARARLRDVIGPRLESDAPRSGRVIAVPGDVTKPRLGMDGATRARLAERTDRIVHCAASVSFTLGLAESRAINVEGTRRMLDLAALCARRGSFDSFTHVSTAYVAGDRRGEVAEDELDVGQGFRNSYERSKFEAELLVRERASAVPVQVVRPSIVVGDSRNGWTSSFNVLYAPLRAFERGAYPAVPARGSAPVDVVPVDYVADAILALGGRPGTSHHLTAGRRASTVGEIIELASASAGRPPPPLLPPGLYRRAIHPVLVRTGSEARRRALRRSEIFFPYFSIDTSFDNTLARAALEPCGLEVPPLRSYFDRLIDFAHQADWGRRDPARDEGASPEPREAQRHSRRTGVSRAIPA